MTTPTDNRAVLTYAADYMINPYSEAYQQQNREVTTALGRAPLVETEAGDMHFVHPSMRTLSCERTIIFHITTLHSGDCVLIHSCRESSIFLWDHDTLRIPVSVRPQHILIMAPPSDERSIYLSCAKDTPNSSKIVHVVISLVTLPYVIFRQWHVSGTNVLLTIAIVWPLKYSISFTIRADVAVTHLVPKGESP